MHNSEKTKVALQKSIVSFRCSNCMNNTKESNAVRQRYLVDNVTSNRELMLMLVILAIKRNNSTCQCASFKSAHLFCLRIGKLTPKEILKHSKFFSSSSLMLKEINRRITISRQRNTSFELMEPLKVVNLRDGLTIIV